MAHFVDEQNPHIFSALKKLSKNLPESLAQHVRYMTEVMRSNPVDRAFVLVLDTMTRAWVEQRTVKLWYRSSSNATVSVREFATYFIEPASKGGLYAVGYDHLSQKIGAVRLQHVKRVQMLSSVYEIPDSYDRRRYLAGAWGMMRSSLDSRPMQIVLSFSPDVLPAVKERLRQTVHVLRIADDKRGLVSVQVSDWRDILPWIRSWGTEVEVLEPKALRDLLAAEAFKLAMVYRGSGAASSI